MTDENSKKKSKRSYQNLQLEGFDPAEANPYDEYLTPQPVVDTCLRCLELYKPVRPDAHFLDPACGYGAWGDGIRYFWPEANLTGVELRNIQPSFDYDTWVNQQDFLTWQSPRWYQYVIGNPPYGIMEGQRRRTLAQEFIECGLDMTYPQGRVAYLLKTVFLEGEDRMQTLYPSKYLAKVYVSSARIPWRPDVNGKSTNTVSYALFIWDKVHKGNPSIGWFNWKTGEII
jgi:hypothetical protein